jgi:hypothetical protein
MTLFYSRRFSFLQKQQVVMSSTAEKLFLFEINIQFMLLFYFSSGKLSDDIFIVVVNN